MSDEQHAAPRRPMEHIDPETIAAWLDEPDDLTAEERAAIQEHMAGCAECRQVAVELRTLVAALAALPEAELPRSFALPAEHARPMPVPPPAARREPTPIRASRNWYDRQMRALRWATAAAAILFVFVLSVDLVTTRIDRSTADDEAVMSMEQSTGAGAQSAAEATPAATDETMAAKAAPEETPTPATEAASLAATPEATPAGAEAQPTAAAAQAETEATAAADAAGSAEAFSGEPEPTASTERTVSRREERLRLLEFGLATLFVWLLAMMIALPRLRRRRGNRS